MSVITDIADSIVAELNVANYAGRFRGYSGEYFETLATSTGAHDTEMVQTQIVLPKDDDIQLNYRLRKIDSGWRIIDVYLNGTVSELAMRRSEYSSTLKREGFESLMDTIDEKCRELASGSTKG